MDKAPAFRHGENARSVGDAFMGSFPSIRRIGSALHVGNASRRTCIHTFGRILVFALGTGIGIDDDISLFHANGLGGTDGDAVVATRAFVSIDSYRHDETPISLVFRRV
jgi:hypothetical protein